MRFLMGKICGFALLFFTLAGGASAAQAAEFLVTEVFKDFFNIHESQFDANSVAIVTPDGVIAVDTMWSPGLAQQVLDEIKKRTAAPIRYVVNTSYRASQIFGNQVFAASGGIIAHKNTRIAMNSPKMLESVDKMKAAGLPGLNDFKITYPNLVYDKSLELIFGGYRVEFKYYGHVHTKGDTLVYLPDMRAIITGPLVADKRIPELDDAHIENWIKVLMQIEELNCEVILPGYGHVGGRPLIIQMRHYLLTLRDWVMSAIERGKTEQETLAAVVPLLREKYSAWSGQEFIESNVRKAFAEFTQPRGSEEKESPKERGKSKSKDDKKSRMPAPPI